MNKLQSIEYYINNINKLSFQIPETKKIKLIQMVYEYIKRINPEEIISIDKYMNVKTVASNAVDEFINKYPGEFIITKNINCAACLDSYNCVNCIGCDSLINCKNCINCFDSNNLIDAENISYHYY